MGLRVVQQAIEVRFGRSQRTQGSDPVIQRVVTAENEDFGFNAATGSYENLVLAGVIDPVKVVRSSFIHAASVSSDAHH